MVVKLRVVLEEGLEVEATVDNENNWTVSGEGLAPDLPDITEEQAEHFAFRADLEERRLGYVPDPLNRWAYALLEAYPGSEIVGGLYPLPRRRRRRFDQDD